MRRRLTWLLAATLAVIAVPIPARSASILTRRPACTSQGSTGRSSGAVSGARRSRGSFARGASAARRPRASTTPTKSPLALVVVPPTFDGVSDADLTSPADPTGALGVTYHLAAVNVRMAFYDRAGVELDTPRLLEEPGRVPAARRRLVRPKVIYDHYRQRFVLVYASASNTQSFLSVVVIPEGLEDDTGQWCAAHVRRPGGWNCAPTT